jgi:hypothetical protein
MKKNLLLNVMVAFLLSACNDTSSPAGADNGGKPKNSGPKSAGELASWQPAAVGQEGHGGDAVVCFSIPIDQAVEKISTESKCIPSETQPCKSSSQTDGSQVATEVWRLTDLGRKNISSAKPLEQYLAERIAGKKEFLTELNQMSVEDGFNKLVFPLRNFPSAFDELYKINSKLGWLEQDGVASEFGLADINDSGFLNENEIDRSKCRELQAAVRRDYQLWYDKDILSHFNNAGKILIQLHEVLYTWGKEKDNLNRSNDLFGPPAHTTSEKTRRMSLKLITTSLDVNTLGEYLKDYGFSIYHWGKAQNQPTALGYFMSSESCEAEKTNLRNYVNQLSSDTLDFWLGVENYFSSNYLRGDNTDTAKAVRLNYPKNIQNLINLTYQTGSSKFFRENFLGLLSTFEMNDSCVGKLTN